MKDTEQLMEEARDSGINLPLFIPESFLNGWLEENCDKEGLEENFLDGHGYWKTPLSEKCLTVYTVKGFNLVFFFHEQRYGLAKNEYTWIAVEDFVKWKDVKSSKFKMNNRF